MELVQSTTSEEHIEVADVMSHRNFHLKTHRSSVHQKYWMCSMISLHCVAFAAWQFYPQLMSRHFLFCKRNLQTGRYHVVFSSQWSHKGLIHLSFMMYALYHRGLLALDQMSYQKLLCLFLGSGALANIATLWWQTKFNQRRDVYSLGASGALMGLNVYLALKSYYKHKGTDAVDEEEDEMEEEEEDDMEYPWQKLLGMMVKGVAPDVLLLFILQHMSRGAEDLYTSCFPAGHLGGALFGLMFWNINNTK